MLWRIPTASAPASVQQNIQALDRTQPILPLRPGLPERQTHDYRRHVPLVALDIATGEVIGRYYRRHRTVEFRKFLNVIDKAVPRNLVLDNYGTHKTALIHNWSARRQRFHLHFTPTSASWLNQVERWFAEITRQQIRRGSWTSTQALEAAIKDDLDVDNEQPRPFIWTKSADQILEAIQRYCQSTNDTEHQDRRCRSLRDQLCAGAIGFLKDRSSHGSGCPTTFLATMRCGLWSPGRRLTGHRQADSLRNRSDIEDEAISLDGAQVAVHEVIMV